jgi:hypothetical protein
MTSQLGYPIVRYLIPMQKVSKFNVKKKQVFIDSDKLDGNVPFYVRFLSLSSIVI